MPPTPRSTPSPSADPEITRPTQKTSKPGAASGKTPSPPSSSATTKTQSTKPTQSSFRNQRSPSFYSTHIFWRNPSTNCSTNSTTVQPGSASLSQASSLSTSSVCPFVCHPVGICCCRCRCLFLNSLPLREHALE